MDEAEKDTICRLLSFDKWKFFTGHCIQEMMIYYRSGSPLKIIAGQEKAQSEENKKEERRQIIKEESKNEG